MDPRGTDIIISMKLIDLIYLYELSFLVGKPSFERGCTMKDCKILIGRLKTGGHRCCWYWARTGPAGLHRNTPGALIVPDLVAHRFPRS